MMGKSHEEMRMFLKSFELIEWGEPAMVSSDARRLIEEHISRMRNVVEHLKRTKGLPSTEAYAEAQSAGYNAPEYGPFLKILRENVTFRGAGMWEPLALAISSCYFWDSDEELCILQNPWSPLVELYKMGYTGKFEEDEKAQKIRLLVGYHNGVESFDLI